MRKRTSEARKTQWTKPNLRNTGLQSANQTPSQVGALPPLAQMFRLQQTVGNQAVVQMLRHSVSEGVIQRNGENNQNVENSKKGTKRKNEESHTSVNNEHQSENVTEPPLKQPKVKIEDELDYETDDEFDVEMEDEIVDEAEEEGEHEAEHGGEQEAENADESETEDENEEFWVRTAVREDGTPKTAKKESFQVHKVSISPERRMTAYVKRQGNHLVAWSAMYRYWNEQLSNKPLPDVLSTLKKWIKSDQRADRNRNKVLVKDNPTNTTKRARALVLINQIENEELSANEINHLLEQAISLFVEANQASSFTVQGTKKPREEVKDVLKRNLPPFIMR